MNKLMHSVSASGRRVVLVALCEAFLGDVVERGCAISRFERGRVLVQNNCYNCIGGSREGMEEGVRLIVDALEHGHGEALEAYELLVVAYNQLGGYAKGEETQVFRRKELEAYEKLLEPRPDDPELLYEYAARLGDQGKAEAVLRKALEVDPGHHHARATLGVLLLRRGASQEGAALLEQAFSAAQGVEARRIGEWWAAALDDLGRHEEAARLRAKLEPLPRE